MKILLMAVTTAAFLSLSACAAMPTAQDLSLQREANATVPHCSSARKCEGEWAAARDWVVSNCEMKIQTFSDSYISTYNAPDGEAGLACQVSKEPIPAGGYAIVFEAGCSNMFGCVPNPTSAAVDFNKAVNDAGARFADSTPAVASSVR